jgi:TM2 domain-containing membrane protein YozV
MIAIILSIIFPGLGQIYYGKTTKGIIMILLALVLFLYPVILVWSIIDCIYLRKKIEVNPVTRKEAITAIIIFFIVIPGITFLLIVGGFTAIEYISNNYAKPKQTKTEMAKISIAIEKYKTENNELPNTIGDVIGPSPLKETWLVDSWKTPYNFKIEENNGYVLISAGKDEQFDTEDDIKITVANKN